LSAPAPSYSAPIWLAGGHAQTIYPLLIKPPAYPYRRERWSTPDGDFIDVDWSEAASAPGQDRATPLVVLFHGLEGSSNSHYALALMHALAARGWGGLVVNFRGCSGEPNLLPRAYHSCDSEEIDWIVRRLKEEHPQRPLCLVGVSLGGQVLLRWLGECEAAASRLVRAAAAVSAPLDYAACGHHLGRGFNRVYSLHFLRTLKSSSAAKLKRFPGLFDARRLRQARTLYEFDDVVTGPIHGFRGAADYWQRAACKPWLPAIRTPTLILNAVNDPFLPPGTLPGTSQVSSAVRLDYPRQGGHVGFVGGDFPGELGWLPQRLLHFFENEA
jgi:predicted alpha/beta-fold hydrolase